MELLSLIRWDYFCAGAIGALIPQLIRFSLWLWSIYPTNVITCKYCRARMEAKLPWFCFVPVCFIHFHLTCPDKRSRQ